MVAVHALGKGGTWAAVCSSCQAVWGLYWRSCV